MTVLFADVSGFTAMSEKLDPEYLAGVMNTQWARLDAVVMRHVGRVDKHIGDALMALWGSEQAREDDPERAIRATLEMQKELGRFREAQGVRTAMRVGLTTGPVLLGTVGSNREFTAMGDIVNLASRLEHAAPVCSVLISHDTCRHMRGVFDMQAQAPLAVKGKNEAVQTHLVEQAKLHGFRTELPALQNAYADAVEVGEADDGEFQSQDRSSRRRGDRQRGWRPPLPCRGGRDARRA